MQKLKAKDFSQRPGEDYLVDNNIIEKGKSNISEDYDKTYSVFLSVISEFDANK